MNIQSVSLDISKRPAIVQTLYLGQGDKNGTTLNASIYENGSAFSLTGKSARFAMRSPKGAGYYEVDGTVSGNVATFAVDETYAATVAGETDCAYVEILEGDTVVCSTNRFRVVVLQNATENADPNGAYTNGVQRFLNDADASLRTLENRAEANIEAAIDTLNDAVDDINGVTDRAEAAIEAMGDISELAVPLMSADTRGGAKLGSGLRVDDGALSVGNLVHSGSGAEVATDGCALYSVDGEGWAEQNGTPTPENPVEIEVCRGRNLLDTANVLNAYINSNSTSIASSSSGAVSVYAPIESGSTYTYSRKAGNRLFIGFTATEPAVGVSVSGIIAPTATATTYTFTAPSSVAYVFIYTGTTTEDGYTQQSLLTELQLELGSTPTPYVPYGHVGLEVTHNGTTTVTPIPLPSKGFAASLPDGTADALAIDSAGKWEWTLPTAETVFDGSGDESWTEIAIDSSANRVRSSLLCGTALNNSANSNVYSLLCTAYQAGSPNSTYTKNNCITIDMSGYVYIYDGDYQTASAFTSYLSSKPMTLLYPLATPTTEHGYIDLPALPSGATVSCLELERAGISVSWFVQGVDELANHAANWGRRALESESRIAALEAAVAELATA